MEHPNSVIPESYSIKETTRDGQSTVKSRLIPDGDFRQADDMANAKFVKHTGFRRYVPVTERLRDEITDPAQIEAHRRARYIGKPIPKTKSDSKAQAKSKLKGPLYLPPGEPTTGDEVPPRPKTAGNVRGSYVPGQKPHYDTTVEEGDTIEFKPEFTYDVKGPASRPKDWIPKAQTHEPEPPAGFRRYTPPQAKKPEKHAGSFFTSTAPPPKGKPAANRFNFDFDSEDNSTFDLATGESGARLEQDQFYETDVAVEQEEAQPVTVDREPSATVEAATVNINISGAVIPQPVPKAIDAPKLTPQAVSSKKETRQEKKQKEKKEWGYGFILLILCTAIGSVTVATYFVVIKSNFSIPNILVNVSIISLLIFLFLVILRYLFLVFMSFLHHSREQSFDDDDKFQHKRVSILVPGYNEGPVIQQSIYSLLDLDYHNFEIIVIDDGSKDDTLAKARALEGMHGTIQVKVLTQKNAGKSHALNHGLQHATGEIIVCMDADSKLHPATLKAGVRHFMNKKIGAIAGNVKVVNRGKMLTKLQALEYIEGLNLVRRAQAFFYSVNIVPGPMGFFRRDLVTKAGGWESDTYAEDCDLTLKLLSWRAGIGYEPAAISYTEAPENLLQLLKQRYRWTRGILQSMRKNRYNLIDPRVGWRVMFTMWQMVFEAIMWPLANIAANALMIIVALLYGMSPLIVLWWVQLTILDILAAMHTVAVEKEQLHLIFYAILYRLIFVQIVDMAKLFATIEELLGIEMKWGKVERLGRL